ncbi:SRPBCC family protein [Rhodobacteraceae bacterium D3-12]|nr:SRPBCC family protein [Rhodobacteraceae bacterium D3-12]
MKFTTREDIEAPIEYVFGVVSDFDGFQRQAMRRGADVARTDSLEAPGEGMAWDIAFPFRGKRREMAVKMVDYAPSHHMVFDSRLTGLNGLLTVDLLALSRGRTRLDLSIELAPQSLSAKLLVQSMKLAKGSLNKRFKVRVAEFAKTTEDKYQQTV